jgi:uncharacterized protein YndB with AHSA1/START domain
MTEPTTDLTLTLDRTYSASPERVYRAWTDPAELRRWFAPDPAMTIDAEVDLRVGGRYRIAMGSYVSIGVYREVVPNRKLVFTWQWQTESGGDETLVTVVIEPDGSGGTRLTLRHDRLPSEAERTSHRDGWLATLARLEPHLATDAGGAATQPTA